MTQDTLSYTTAAGTSPFLPSLVSFIQRVLTYGGQAPPSSVSGTTTSRYYSALSYHQANLISNRSDQGAPVADPSLQNPCGLTFGPANPLWVADNNADGTEAAKSNLTAALPGGRASTGDGSSPTCQVANPTTGFRRGPRQGP
jgi:hypothetical protein